MTSYIAITDAETDPEAPLTSELAKKWRDNPIAITEGATGAPRIVAAAMYRPTSGTVVQRDCLPWGSETNAASGTETITNLLRASPFTALVSCTVQVRLTFTMASSGGGSSNSVAVLKNGTSVQTYTTSQTGVTVNVSLSAGETLAIRTRSISGGAGQSADLTISVCEYRVDTRSVVMS